MGIRVDAKTLKWLKEQGHVQPQKITRPKGPNKLEEAYMRQLDFLKTIGAVKSWKYESLKLRLAEGAWYTPDFFVELTDGVLEIHETKGFMREAAFVRLKVAAEQYPQFRFKLVKRIKGLWDIQPVKTRS
jgi:hypothetical protein